MKTRSRHMAISNAYHETNLTVKLAYQLDRRWTPQAASNRCSEATEGWGREVGRLPTVATLLGLHGAFWSSIPPETCIGTTRVRNQVPLLCIFVTRNLRNSILVLAHHVITVRKSISLFPNIKGNNGRYCTISA